MERLVSKQLINYLNTNSLFHTRQNTHRKFHSPETLLLYILDDFHNKLDNNSNIQIILLVLSAVFDTICNMWGALARRRVQSIRLTVNQASGNLPGLGRIVRKETAKTNLEFYFFISILLMDAALGLYNNIIYDKWAIMVFNANN